MVIYMEKAKQLAYKTWQSTLPFLRRHPKCRDYGFDETADTLWAKLPKVSKMHWIGQAA